MFKGAVWGKDKYRKQTASSSASCLSNAMNNQQFNKIEESVHIKNRRDIITIQLRLQDSGHAQHLTPHAHLRLELWLYCLCLRITVCQESHQRVCNDAGKLTHISNWQLRQAGEMDTLTSGLLWSSLLVDGVSTHTHTFQFKFVITLYCNYIHLQSKMH